MPSAHVTGLRGQYVARSVWDAFRAHAERWFGCTACPLSNSRRRLVLFRGQLPCDVLFIGEAPGKSEDMSGLPFVGEAGWLLDSIIREVQDAVGEFRYAITNVVCCLPPIEETTGKVRAPNRKEAAACSERLVEFLRIAQPRLVVALGAVASKHVPIYSGQLTVVRVPPYSVVSVTHPAAILHKQGTPQAGLDLKRATLTITETVRKVL